MSEINSGPLYYAKGCEVWKRPIHKPRPGGTTISLGFRVCIVDDVVGEEGANTVAKMLTVAENYEQRTEGAEPIGCPLPGACSCPRPTPEVTEGMIERAWLAVRAEREAILSGPLANHMREAIDAPNRDVWCALIRAALVAALQEGE